MDLTSLVTSIIAGVSSGLTVTVVSHRLAIRQFRATRLHDKRIELIGQFLGTFNKIERSLYRLTNECETWPDPSDREFDLLNATSSDLANVSAIYWGNSAFLEPSVCEDVEEFLEVAKAALDAWWDSVTSTTKDVDDRRLAAARAYEWVLIIRARIEKSFRQTLGTKVKADPWK